MGLRCARLTLYVIVAIGFAGCSKTELAARPPRSAESASFSPQPSTLGARVLIPIDALKTLLEAKLPQRFSGSGQGGDACTKLLFTKVCAGTQYDYAVQRNGPLQLSVVSPSTLRLTLPLAFSGHGGFRGDGAKRLHLDARPFNGALLVNADITPQLGNDWCPHLALKLSDAWVSDPKVELVHGLWVDVRQPIQAKLDARLPELVARAQGAVDCGKFKARLAEVYGSKTFPVKILNSTGEYLNIRPTGLGFSGLHIDPTAVSAALTLTGEMAIEPQPLTPAPLPLPPLKNETATAPRLSVALPVRVPYSVVAAAIGHTLVGKTFERSTPAGQVSVRVDGIEVYPSQGQLVVGLHIAASTPGLAPNAKGEVYLIATPSIEDGRRISLPDAHYSAVLDSVFWQAVSALFEGQIKNDIRKAAVYDLGPTLAKGEAAIVKSLTDPSATPGASVTLSNVDLKLGRIALADQDLTVEGLLSASASLEPKP